MNKRNIFIDIVRGIGILLVVFGHCINGNALVNGLNINNMIYIFHMPLFFIISGYVIKYEKEQGLKEFIKKKIKSIIGPHIVFSLLCFVYWFLIERKIRNQMGTSVLAVFLNIFIGIIDDSLLLPNVVLWFLPCLFSALVLFHFIKKIKRELLRCLVVTCTFVIGIIICNYKIALPFALETSFVAILFIYIGFILSKYDIDNKKRSIYLLFPIFIVMYVIAYIYNGNVSMLGHYYGNPFIFIIGVLGGSGIVLALSIIISKVKIIDKSFAFLGMNSIVIMLCHEPIKRIVAKCLSVVFKVSDEVLRNGILGSLAITIIVIIIMIPIILVINRYLPFMIGKKKINK